MSALLQVINIVKILKNMYYLIIVVISTRELNTGNLTCVVFTEYLKQMDFIYKTSYVALWNPEVKCHIQNVSIILILNRIYPIPRIVVYFFKSILILPSHLRLSLSIGIFSVDLSVKIFGSTTSLILGTFPANIIILD